MFCVMDVLLFCRVVSFISTLVYESSAVLSRTKEIKKKREPLKTPYQFTVNESILIQRSHRGEQKHIPDGGRIR